MNYVFSIIKAVEQGFISLLNDAELAGESLAIELSDTAREIPFAIVNQDTRFVSSWQIISPLVLILISIQTKTRQATATFFTWNLLTRIQSKKLLSSLWFMTDEEKGIRSFA